MNYNEKMVRVLESIVYIPENRPGDEEHEVRK